MKIAKSVLSVSLTLSATVWFLYGLADANASPALVSQASASYAVTQKFELSGISRWDFITFDEVRSRLFVTRADRVEVLDSKSGELVGTIADTSGVHGVAVAQDLKLGFTSNGRADSVTVFDLDSLKTLDTIKVTGANPDAIMYHAPNQSVYTFNGKTGNITVINAKSRTVTNTIEVGGKLELPATDGKNIFVNVEDKATIAVIDLKTNKVKTSWPLKGCEEPTGLAFDAKNKRLFSVCNNEKMVVTNAKTGEQVASVAIGAGPDGAAYDPATHMIFTSNGKAGTVTVIKQVDANHYRVVETVPTEKGAKTSAYDSATKRLFMPTVVADKFMVLVMSPK